MAAVAFFEFNCWFRAESMEEFPSERILQTSSSLWYLSISERICACSAPAKEALPAARERFWSCLSIFRVTSFSGVFSKKERRTFSFFAERESSFKGASSSIALKAPLLSGAAERKPDENEAKRDRQSTVRKSNIRYFLE